MTDQDTTGALGPAPTDLQRPSLLGEHLDILRRRIWVVIPLVIISATFGLISAFNAPRIYRATTRMLVEKQAPNVMKFDRESQEGDASDPDFYSTQTELMRSRVVMDHALAEPGITKLFEAGTSAAAKSSFLSEIKRTVLAMLGAEPAPPPEAWGLLRDKVHVVHVKESHFITIDGLDESPHAAADIANATARAYMEYHRERKVELLGQQFALLQKERDKEEASLLQSEQALQAFREQARSVAINTSEDQPSVERMVKLNQQLTEVQLKRIELGSQIGVMKEALEADKSDSEVDAKLFAVPAVQTDLALSETRKSLSEAEKELSILGQTYGRRHPRYQAAQTNVVLLRQQFKSGLKEIISSHDNSLQMLVNEEKELGQSYEAQKKEALDLSKESFEYTRLQNAVDRHRQLFDSIAERMREVDVTSGLAQTNIQIIEKAAPPSTPISQGRARKVMASALFGFFLGGILALLFENLDDTIKTPEDLKGRLRAPFLGFVPAVLDPESPDAAKAADAGETAGSETPREPGADETPAEPPGQSAMDQIRAAYRDTAVIVRQRLSTMMPKVFPMQEAPQKRGTPKERAYRGTIVLSEPMSSVAEAYRGIRASLFYSMPAAEIKTLSITSSRPQEGKTTTSCNLALSVAQTGKRVLLIDGDLHRPSVHTVLGITNTTGLTSVLVGEKSRTEAVRKLTHNGRTVECLDILTAGPSSPSPSELLGSNAMRDLLAQARSAYDWVIVDTPPILFVSDAAILSTMCDGVIVVVKSGNSTRSLLNRTTEQLLSLKAHIVGSILNGVVVTRMGRHYSSYYSYGYARYAKEYHRTYYQGDEESTTDEVSAATPSPAPDQGGAPESVPPGDAPATPPTVTGGEDSPADAALAARLAQSEAQARSLRGQLEETVRRAGAQEESLRTLAQQVEQAQAVQKQADELRERLAAQAETVAALTQQLEQTRPLREQLEEYRKRSSSQSDILTTLSQELEEARRRLRDQEGRKVADPALESRLAELGDKVLATEAEGEAEKTRRTRAELRAVATEARLQQAQAAHDKAMEEHRDEQQRMKRELDDLARAHKLLQTTLQEARADAEQHAGALQKRVQTAEAEREAAKRAVTDLQAKMKAEVEAERDDAEAEAEQEIQDLQARLKEAQAVAAAAKTGVAERERAQATLELTIRDLKEELKKSEAEGARVQEELAAAKTGLASANTAERETSEAAAAERVLELEKQLTEARAVAARAQLAGTERVESAAGRIRELEAKVAELSAATPLPREIPRTSRECKLALRQAQTYLATGSHADAARVLQGVVEAQPRHAEAWELLLEALWLAHDDVQLQRCLDRFPDIVGLREDLPLLARGHLTALRGNAHQAYQQYHEALQRRPGSRGVLEGITMAAVQRKDRDAAREHARRLLRIHPKSAHGHYVTAYLQMLDGDAKAAEQSLLRSLKERRTAEALNDLAWLLSEQGRHEEAERMAREAVAINEHAAAAWESLGGVLVRAKRLDQAEKVYRQALTLTADHIGAMISLADLFALQGKRAQALEFTARLAGMQDRLSADERNRLSAIRIAALKP